MKNAFLPTRNALLLGEAIEPIFTQRPESARFVFVDGPAGTGKTSIAHEIKKRHDALYYSVSEVETARSLLSSVLRALHGWIVDLHQIAALYGRLLEDLEHAGWPPLIFDEADRLDRTRSGVNLLEVVRDIHDCGRSPIILFSIAHLRRRLANPAGGYAEAFSSRIAAHVRFDRASIEDAELLAQRLVEGVKLDGDLIAHCLTASGGSLRPLLALFAQIEGVARSAGIFKVNLAKWLQLASYAGLPAAPARHVKRAPGAAERPKAVA